MLNVYYGEALVEGNIKDVVVNRVLPQDAVFLVRIAGDHLGAAEEGADGLTDVVAEKVRAADDAGDPDALKVRDAMAPGLVPQRGVGGGVAHQGDALPPGDLPLSYVLRSGAAQVITSTVIQSSSGILCGRSSSVLQMTTPSV